MTLPTDHGRDGRWRRHPRMQGRALPVDRVKGAGSWTRGRPSAPPLRAAMVRDPPASAMAASGTGLRCADGRSPHTFGPMLPMGPRSPLCPEHLQGTPQQAFSAMLSCQNEGRSGLRPGLEKRRPRPRRKRGLPPCTHSQAGVAANSRGPHLMGSHRQDAEEHPK